MRFTDHSPGRFTICTELVLNCRGFQPPSSQCLTPTINWHRVCMSRRKNIISFWLYWRILEKNECCWAYKLFLIFPKSFPVYATICYLGKWTRSFHTNRLFHVTGREHLTAKTMHAFDYAYRQHLNEFDWFIKADDDTYLIVENLRYMLSAQSPQEPVYFGHHFKTIVNQGKRFMYCGPNLRAHMCIYNASSNKHWASPFGTDDFITFVTLWCRFVRN